MAVYLPNHLPSANSVVLSDASSIRLKGLLTFVQDNAVASEVELEPKMLFHKERHAPSDVVM